MPVPVPVEYPIDWVLEILEEMKLKHSSLIGDSLSFKRAGNGRRVLIRFLPSVLEYAIIDNMEAAGLLEEYYAARDKNLSKHLN